MNPDTSSVDLNTLQWVKSEIDETLKQARIALEAHVESPEDDSQLQLVVKYLHQVRGTLQMVELYGAAMLSEELEILTQAMVNKEVEGRDDIYEVIMRAMWQLPDYLERLQSGHKDIPMVLLPLLNDLRAARGDHLLTESALFTPDLDVYVPNLSDQHSPEELPLLAKKLRHTYHLGLLDWFRENDSDGGLEKLDQVIEKLRHAANDQEVNRVLWSASGVVEALREGGIKPSVAVKLLMGKLDLEIKKIIDRGESVLSNERPEELEKNLLYYVASSSSEGEKVNALKKTFKLAEALPDEATLERARADLSGPNAELLHTVSKVLLENLLQVKDQLDIFMRADERDPSSLSPLTESLGQTADTLGMLGFGKQRQIVVEQNDLLTNYAQGKQDLDENTLLDIAHELLSLESILQGTKSGKTDISNIDENHAEIASEAAQQELLESVMAEARKNMGKVKDAMGSFIETPRNISLIHDVPDWLDQIRGSFDILSLERPAQLIDTCRMYVQQEMIDAKRSPDPASTDALADALSSIEYYMDSMAGQWGNPKAILEVAEQRLAQIGFGEHIQALNSGIGDAQPDDEDTQSELPVNDVTENAQPDTVPSDQIPDDDDDTMIDLGTLDIVDSNAAAMTLEEEPSGMDIELSDMSTAELSLTDFEAELEAKGLTLEETDAGNDTQEIDISGLVLESDAEQTAETDVTDLGSSHELPFDSEQFAIDNEAEQIVQPEQIAEDISGEISFAAEEIELPEEGNIPSESNNEIVFDASELELPEELELDDTSVNSSTTTQEIEFDASQLDISDDLDISVDLNDDLESDDVSINTSTTTQEIEFDAGQLDIPDDLDGDLELADTSINTSTTTQEIEFDASQLDIPDNLVLDGEPEPESDVKKNLIQATGNETDVTESRAGGTSNDTQEIEFDSSIIEIIDNEKLPEHPPITQQVKLSVKDIPDLTEKLEAWYADTNNEVLTKKLRKSITSIKKQAKEMGRDDVAKVANDMAALFKSINKGETFLTAEAKNSLHFAIDTLSEVLPAEPQAATDNVVPLKPILAKPSPTPDVYQVSEEIDDEIIEIFLEEAVEEIGNIEQRLASWRVNPSNEESLRELRRSFHTLKGSGRLVGASEVGEFAWAFENMLNRVIDHTIESGVAVFDLVDAARKKLPDLLEKFQSRDKAGQEVFALMEQAEAVSQGTADSVSQEKEVSGQTVREEVTYQNSAAVNVGEVVPEIDETLLDIYRKETANHLDALQDYLDEWNSGNDKTANHKLVRVLHTLKGSSRTAGVPGVADLCHRFEKLTNEMSNHDIEVSDSMLTLLNKSMDFVQETVSVLDKPGTPLPDSSGLIEQLEEQEASISARILSSTMTKLNEDTESESRHDIPGTEHTGDIEPELNHVTSRSEYDEELLQIFIEEGTEILEECDQTLHQWASDRDNPEHIEALQRQLHTLKGGARMAGVTAIGDLSHAIESMLTAISNNRIMGSTEVYDALQKSQDKLVRLLEQLKENEPLTADIELINQVEQLTGNQTELVEMPEQDIPGISIEEIDVVDFSETGLPTEEVIDEPELITAEPVTEEESVQDLEVPDYEINLEESTSSRAVEPEPAEVAEGELVPDNVVAMTSLQPLNVTAKAPVTEEETLPERSTTREQVRVRSELLDNLVNFAGEVSIYRSRMEQQTNAFRYNLQELDDTVSRLRDQLRKFEMEAEAQIQYRAEESLSRTQEDFDPLEFDRFTQMQQLSRGMLESLNDLDSLRGILGNLTRESETLLVQQSRVNTELQEGLMRTRMVPFSTQSGRLRRIVRQTAEELGKKAELHLHGADSELDRTVLDRMLPALEHMLRNAVAHGIESDASRSSQGKPETGQVNLNLSREGADIVMTLSDDGAGMDLDAIQRKAIEKGKLKPGSNVTKEALLELIMESGFSTAETVNQIAGRGVGMDVVNSEIKQLGGLLNIDTEQGRGTTFTVSLPLTLSVTRALMVQVGEETYAIPLLSVEGVERINTDKLQELYNDENPVYQWIGQDYPFMHLGSTMGLTNPHIPTDRDKIPLLMVRSGEYRAAVQVDSLIGSREVVVKPVGAQLSTIRGISGATIMGDGSVVLIIDLGVLIRRAAQEMELTQEYVPKVVQEIEKVHTPLVMVVDDSITVRKVTTRLLERNEYRATSAKDGVDALAQLQEVRPDVILLDVEMPRMDGFELATNIRNDEKLQDIPIVMITSRTGQKHRDRAESIGVNFYLGKPYNEDELLESIRSLLETV